MSEALQAQIEQLVEILERELGVLDPLTGLYGPRYLVSRLAEEVERSDRFGQHVSLVVVRIDAPPEVLRSAGMAMRKACRRYDIPSRLSQAELAIALPGTDPEDANAWAERFLERMRSAHKEAMIRIAVRHYPSPEVRDAASLLNAARVAVELQDDGDGPAL